MATEAATETRILNYLPRVKIIALGIASRLPVHVHADVDDLFQQGCLGLIDAARRFDESRGMAFSTFANARVTGAMLDAIRAADWAPRSVRCHGQAIQEAEETLRQRLGHKPDDDALATELGMALDDLHKWRQKLAGQYFSYEGLPRNFVLKAMWGGPPRSVEGSINLRRQLDRACQRLDERTRYVLAAYYVAGETFGEISDTLGVDPSRVSQIHTEAMKHLRTWLAKQAVPRKLSVAS